MKLLTAELRASLPPLYAQEKVPDPIVHAKFFTPDSNWTWYVTEGEPDEDGFRFFGYVCGLEEEWATSCSPRSSLFAARWAYPSSAISTSLQPRSVK